MGVEWQEGKFHIHLILLLLQKGHNLYGGVNMVTKSQELVCQRKYSFIY